MGWSDQYLSASESRTREHVPSVCFFAILLASLFLGCSSPDPTDSKDRSGWIKKSDDNKSVIIFVHGFLGNAKETWTARIGETQVYWPDLVAKDEQSFSGASVYALEYETDANAKLNIPELAQHMLTRLRADKVLEYDRLIFVMHSMGGLVTRKFLIDNPSLASRIGFLYFYSTPTQGSHLAALLSAIRGNAQLQQLVPATSANVLGNLMKDWFRREFKFPSYCAYEKRKTRGIMVVEFNSAVPLCSKVPVPIDADHVDIVKPADDKAIAYLELKNAYVDLLKSAERERASQPTPPTRVIQLWTGWKPKVSEASKKASVILNKEFVGGLGSLFNFRFVDLAGHGSERDLVATYKLKGGEDSLETYLSVLVAKDNGYENVLTEKFWTLPEVFLAWQGANTYIVISTVEGSAGLLALKAYRWQSAGNFAKIQIDEDAAGGLSRDVGESLDRHKIKALGDGLYVLNGARLRMVFQGDRIVLKDAPIASGDLGSTAHVLDCDESGLSFDGKRFDVRKPIVIGRADRVRNTCDAEGGALASGNLTWVTTPAGIMLKPTGAGSGELSFRNRDVTIKIEVR